jgi:hypothetical protein
MGRLFAMPAGKFTFQVSRGLVTTTHQVTEARSVESPVYAVHQDASKLTVAELADTAWRKTQQSIARSKRCPRLQQSHFNADDATREADEGSPAE